MEIPKAWAIRSMALKPTLCLVPSYCEPGFPNPIMIFKIYTRQPSPGRSTKNSSGLLLFAFDLSLGFRFFTARSLWLGFWFFPARSGNLSGFLFPFFLLLAHEFRLLHLCCSRWAGQDLLQLGLGNGRCYRNNRHLRIL